MQTLPAHPLELHALPAQPLATQALPVHADELHALPRQAEPAQALPKQTLPRQADPRQRLKGLPLAGVDTGRITLSRCAVRIRPGGLSRFSSPTASRRA